MVARVNTLPPYMCEYLSLEVETRKHAERSKVAGVLQETSIPYFGITEDIILGAISPVSNYLSFFST